MATLDAATGREETTDDTGDVTADVEGLRVVHTDALYPETEAADAWKDDRLALWEPLFQDVLQFRHDTDDGSLAEAPVTTSLGGYLVKGYLALTHRFGKIFPIRTASLNIVLNQFDMYCYFFLCFFL